MTEESRAREDLMSARKSYEAALIHLGWCYLNPGERSANMAEAASRARMARQAWDCAMDDLARVMKRETERSPVS